jgi:hypothetical protein
MLLKKFVAVGGLVILSCSALFAQFEYAGRGGAGALNAVYRISCPDQDRGGTAFGHRSGKIITAEHVIHGCDVKQLQVASASGETTAIVSLVADPDLDIALLSPSNVTFVKNPLPITAEFESHAVHQKDGDRNGNNSRNVYREGAERSEVSAKFPNSGADDGL